MRIAATVVSIATLLLASAPALPHHSFSAEFDIGRPVELTGTVTRVEWTNPHAWIFIVTDDGDGEMQSWAVEMLGVNSLMRRGIRRDTISPGDSLIIEGFGARDGSNTANASAVINADTGEELWASAAGDRN